MLIFRIYLLFWENVLKNFNLEKCAIQRFAEILGFLVSYYHVVKYGPVYIKTCDRLQFQALQPNFGNGNSKLIIDFNACIQC